MQHDLITALAFDYGLKNIGLAFGQSLTGSAQELPPLKAKNGVPNWKDVALLVKEWQPSLFIIGLPLNMDGSESELSQRTRTFHQQLFDHFNIHIKWMDERLSTFEAKIHAKERGHKGNYRDKPVDSIAARLILESWFANNSSHL